MPRRRSIFGRRRSAKDLQGIGAVVFLLVVVWVIQNLWPLLVAGAVAAVGWGFWQSYERRQRLRALRLSGVDGLSGAEFEEYLAFLFARHGYGVDLVGRAGDQGCDLILEKDGKRVACQAKRYAKKVPNDAVAEAVAAKAFHACDDAMVVTNSVFTRGAKQLARANGCELVDRASLAEMIRDVRDQP